MKSSNNPNLKRVLVDFKKLTPEILSLVVAKYPDGYDDKDIISFRNANYELVEAVEIITDDTKYLIKVSEKLEKVMDEYNEEDYEAYDDDDPSAVQDAFDQEDE